MEKIGKISSFFFACVIVGLMVGIVTTGGKTPETVQERAAAVMSFGKNTQFFAYSDEDRAYLDGLVAGASGR